MARILITGANGQLGRELHRQIEKESHLQALLTDRNILDISDYNEVLSYLNIYRPDCVINCAAYTAVEQCETHEEEAYRANAVGAKNLAMAAAKTGSKIIQISTDYVFDGKAKVPYTEDSVTNPVNVYGRTKLQGEKFVQQYNPRHFIVRTAWLYGDGNNFLKTMLRLAENNKEIKVVNDQWGTPTSTRELARMILELAVTEKYGIYHGTCEGSTSWYEFAAEIFSLAQKDIRVIPITTQEYPAAIERPAYSVLENQKYKQLFSKTFKPWQEALKEYMEEIK